MDAVTAFLQGELSEEIYMEQPDGFEDGSNRVCKLRKSEEIYMEKPDGFEDGSNRVCKLRKAIYGLKQSGRGWKKKLDSTLKSLGLSKSPWMEKEA
ncbi:Reverse transcriptase (RNA-dependent DNA polymerase) [Popillia japonica]|uniref:Reverse transcriptase (RNA-dependent DNA polymerase) n=1 Tax=Popillia japonica TaxID=7064 RepID=A0AAW1JN44_POPJA